MIGCETATRQVWPVFEGSLLLDGEGKHIIAISYSAFLRLSLEVVEVLGEGFAKWCID